MSDPRPDRARRRWPRALIAAVASFVAWGGGQALFGRTRRAVAWLIAIVGATALTTVTVYALFAAIALFLVQLVDAARVGYRAPPEPPLRWPAVGLGFVATATFVVSLRQVVFAAYVIPSSSMAPTIRAGDHILVEQVSRLWRAPARGDLIAFRGGDGRAFVKRVVAIGGDTVAIHGGALIVDGEAVSRGRIGEARYWNQDRWRDAQGRALVAGARGRVRRGARRARAIGSSSRPTPGSTRRLASRGWTSRPASCRAPTRPRSGCTCRCRPAGRA